MRYITSKWDWNSEIKLCIEKIRAHAHSGERGMLEEGQESCSHAYSINGAD